MSRVRVGLASLISKLGATSGHRRESNGRESVEVAGRACVRRPEVGGAAGGGRFEHCKSWRHKVLGGEGIFQFYAFNGLLFPSLFTFQPADEALAPAPYALAFF